MDSIVKKIVGELWKGGSSMEDLECFLGEEALPETKKVVISKRLFGEDGKPLVWEVKAISEQENRSIKGGEHIEQYWGRLCGACVVSPVLTREGDKVRILKELLTIGEYMILLKVVQEQNGFVKRKEEAKTRVKKQFGRA